MSPIFVSQETIDRWLTEDRIDVEGERITLKPYGLAVELVPAVHLVQEVAGGGDEKAWLGKVKSIQEIEGEGGEHDPGSVILGESAYEVVEGFIGRLAGSTDPGLAESARRTLSQITPKDGLEALARHLVIS
ncbi:MAG: hypothetical protein GX614_10165 [Sandaracinaceae bacterium]|nr:hypothetical protein [Sandaracinaceae bacterium]